MAPGILAPSGAGGTGFVPCGLAPAARTARPLAARPPSPVHGFRRDTGRIRFRADLPRQRPARDLRLHGAWHRVGVHAVSQSRRVRLGPVDRRRRSRSGRRRHVDRAVRARHAQPDHARPDGAPARSAPGRRTGDAPGRDDHVDDHDREQRLELSLSAHRRRRGGTALVPALRHQRARPESRGARFRTGSGRPDHRRDDRPAGVILRTGSARPPYRRRGAPGDPPHAAESTESVSGRGRPAVVRMAALRQPASHVRSPDAGEGDSHRRGREDLYRTRCGRHRGLQPRRAGARLRTIEPRGARRGGPGGGWPGAGADRQRLPPRYRRAEGAGPGRRRRVPRPRLALGPRSVR